LVNDVKATKQCMHLMAVPAVSFDCDSAIIGWAKKIAIISLY